MLKVTDICFILLISETSKHHHSQYGSFCPMDMHQNTVATSASEIYKLSSNFSSISNNAGFVSLHSSDSRYFFRRIVLLRMQCLAESFKTRIKGNQPAPNLVHHCMLFFQKCCLGFYWSCHAFNIFEFLSLNQLLDVVFL